MISQTITESLCLFALGILAGAMVYESVVEIGVRKSTNAQEQLHNWQRVYPVACGLFKPFGTALIPVSIICGIRSGNWVWYIATIALLILIPFTAIALGNINEKLLSCEKISDEIETKNLIAQWGKFHHVRTTITVFSFALGVIAFVS